MPSVRDSAKTCITQDLHTLNQTRQLVHHMVSLSADHNDLLQQTTQKFGKLAGKQTKQKIALDGTQRKLILQAAINAHVC